MLDFYTGRAMQMKYLTENQIKRIQTTERRCGYPLPNWNIQSLLGVPEIKTQYGIPEDDLGAQGKHTARIRSEIEQAGLRKMVESGSASLSDLDDAHSYDWAVFHDDSVQYHYQGRGKKVSLESELMGLVPLLAVLGTAVSSRW